MKSFILGVCLILLGSSSQAKTMDEKIANMFMIGFYGTSASKNSQIIKDICHRGLGGVILFDRHPSIKGKAKNISSPQQLKKLTYTLTHSCKHTPLIAVDQEGGRVQRLKNHGFYGKYPSASTIGKQNMSIAKSTYSSMAKELSSVGINFNLAPVADLAVNKKNRVIYGLGRSYGSDPKRVALLDKIFINAMHKQKVLTSLKHFPGHGSSLGDTHKGFVDVTNTWSKKELKPFASVINAKKADSIMIAHIFNKHIDSRYPASLSRKTITKLLRHDMHYDGVAITDDLQMYAISKHYSVENTIKLAINAGADILLFGNQLDPKLKISLSRLVSITKKLLAKGEIQKSSILKANKRIDRMKSKIGLNI